MEKAKIAIKITIDAIAEISVVDGENHPIYAEIDTLLPKIKDLCETVIKTNRVSSTIQNAEDSSIVRSVVV